MDFPVRLGWWPVLHLVVALSAIAHGAILVAVWADPCPAYSSTAANLPRYPGDAIRGSVACTCTPRGVVTVTVSPSKSVTRTCTN